jgi:hypothetical protein
MNNEILPKREQDSPKESDSTNEWDTLMSSDLTREEHYIRTKQALAKLKAEFPTTEIEKEKTLDEEYRNFLNKLAERDGVNYNFINKGLDIIINYGTDNVHMISHTNARVGEKGPISGYFVVSPEDAAKTWFQEMINEVGGDVRIDESQQTNPNR